MPLGQRVVKFSPSTLVASSWGRLPWIQRCWLQCSLLNSLQRSVNLFRFLLSSPALHPALKPETESHYKSSFSVSPSVQSVTTFFHFCLLNSLQGLWTPVEEASSAEEAEVERFYKDLQDLLELTTKKDVLFIIGDWNAKVGSQETPGVTGKFGLGVQNEAWKRLIWFAKRTHWS